MQYMPDAGESRRHEQTHNYRKMASFSLMKERFSIQRLLDKELIPFFAFVIIYFVAYHPFSHYPPENIVAALFKVLPVWSLAFYVYSRSYKLQKSDYARHFIGGLFASSLGDASLIWRERFFIPGMIFFAVAHYLYLCGLSEKVDSANMKRTRSLFLLLFLVLYLFVSSGIVGYIMLVLVFIYTGLIVSVGWLATARLQKDQSLAALFGLIGAMLFMFSDFIIATDKWRFHIPLAEILIMVSYYVAQFFLALSTVEC